MTPRSLRIAEDLRLPGEAVTEKLAFLGRTGSGKTYAAQKLAEEMHRLGAQFIALDPVGKWWSLRLAADGKSPGIPIPVLGGLQGDIPLEPTGGKLVADLVADRGISIVLDVSQFESDADKARFARDFAARFFFRKKTVPSAVHVFVEEAQELVPQNLSRSARGFEEEMLHNFTRMWKLGRNFGIGGSLISQRPQEVNKKVLNLTELLFCFQLTGSHERKALDQWIRDKAIDEDIEAELPRLQQGQPHVWSPGWLQLSKVVEISEKWTYDASATPAIGARAESRPLGPIDLAKLRETMAATIERAKQEDPKALRTENAQLRSQLTAAQKKLQAPATARVTKEVEKRVEVPVLTEGQLKRLEGVSTKLVQFGERVVAVGQDVVVVGREITAALARRHQSGNGGSRHAAPPLRVAPAPPRRSLDTPRRRPRAAEPPADTGGVRPSAGARRMLEAIARRYPVPTTEAQCAQLAKVKRSGGTFGTYKSDLLRGGYMVETRDGLELTDLGWNEIGMMPGQAAPQTTDDLLRLYEGTIRAGARRMIDILMEAYPSQVDRASLAEQANVALQGGTFGTYLSDLRKAGLIEEQGDEVSASELLMNPAGAEGSR